MNIINLGVKYYRYLSNGELEILRVISGKDANNIKCSVKNSLVRKHISLQELEDNYIKLRPDGFMYFNIAKVQELTDVIVTLYRSDDIDMKEELPFAICRQSITDIFANMIRKTYDDLICGVSISKESIPEGISMDTVLSCDSLINTCGIAVYMDDSLRSIIRLIKTKDYDIALYNLFMDHVKYKYPDDKDIVNKGIVDGYCKTLKDLLLSNNFMYDLYRGFDIYPLAITISPEEINGNLSRTHNKIISNIVLKNITGSLVIEYNKYFDLTKIERNYIIIVDDKDKLYIIAYLYSGQYTIPIDEIESQENIDKLSNIKGYANSASIKAAIKFDTNKYL